MLKYGLNYLSRILRTCVQITRIRASRPGKLAILLTYVRCWMKHVLFVRLLKRSIDHEQIFGLKVRFFNYSTFMYLFEAVFITQEYYFQSKSNTPLIVDCGANVGMAILYFKLMYPQARVLAFEPDVTTFQKLLQNVQENGLQDVTVLNFAVSDCEGEIEFFSDPTDPGSLIMSTVQQMRMPVATAKVKAVRLSTYINEHVDLLKIDVEGAEKIVLEELAKERKLGCITEMVIEYHHHLVRNDDTLSHFLRILEESDWGYELAATVPETRTAFQNILVNAYAKSILKTAP